jgi:hypothetical protein
MGIRDSGSEGPLSETMRPSRPRHAKQARDMNRPVMTLLVPLLMSASCQHACGSNVPSTDPMPSTITASSNESLNESSSESPPPASSRAATPASDSHFESDVSEDSLERLEQALCGNTQVEWVDACARLRDFRAGSTPDLSMLVGKRFMGYGYEGVHGFPGYHHGRSFEDLMRLERELYLSEFRDDSEAAKVAFFQLEPETQDEFRDVPLAHEALREGRSIPETNVALQFAETHRISSSRFFAIEPTSGTSMRIEYTNYVAARVKDDRLILLELHRGGEYRPGTTFFLWVFPLSRALNRH